MLPTTCYCICLAADCTLIWCRQPSIVEISVLRVGSFVILCLPGEPTTMAGRRLREAVYDQVCTRLYQTTSMVGCDLIWCNDPFESTTNTMFYSWQDVKLELCDLSVSVNKMTCCLGRWTQFGHTHDNHIEGLHQPGYDRHGGAASADCTAVIVAIGTSLHRSTRLTTLSSQHLMLPSCALLLVQVKSAWGNETHVVIAGLTNTYASYIATYEEYQVQRYEGASTIFGPHTLDAYIQVTPTSHGHRFHARHRCAANTVSVSLCTRDNSCAVCRMLILGHW